MYVEEIRQKQKNQFSIQPSIQHVLTEPQCFQSIVFAVHSNHVDLCLRRKAAPLFQSARETELASLLIKLKSVSSQSLSDMPLKEGNFQPPLKSKTL